MNDVPLARSVTTISARFTSCMKDFTSTLHSEIVNFEKEAISITSMLQVALVLKGRM